MKTKSYETAFEQRYSALRASIRERRRRNRAVSEAKESSQNYHTSRKE